MSGAIDRLVKRNEAGNWPSTFRLRGRTYTLIPGGPSSFWEEDGVEVAELAVFGRRRPVKVRDTDPVEVLTYESPLSGSVLAH